MPKDNHGYSLVELLAIIVITSFILLPLLGIFVNNVSIYDRLEKRRSAVGIVDVITNNIDRLNFAGIKTALDDDSTEPNYTVINSASCVTIFDGLPQNQEFCSELINLTYNNLSIPENINIYFFDWNITASERDAILSSSLPDIVKQDIIFDDVNLVTETTESDFLMRYIIIAQYSDEPSSLVSVGGVMIDD